MIEFLNCEGLEVKFSVFMVIVEEFFLGYIVEGFI